MEDEVGFDQEIRNLLERAYQAALKINGNAKTKFNPDHIKLMIVTTHMDSLAKALLHADEHDVGALDMKKMALGIYGTIDWIREDLESK